MHATAKRHLEAINRGFVTRSTVIGLRKAFNAYERNRLGWSIGATAPLWSRPDLDAVAEAIEQAQPPVAKDDPLHAGGLAVLRNPKYEKRWTPAQRQIIGDLDRFELVRMDYFDHVHTVPVFRAVASWGGSFLFRNIPWQSGGNGPEIVEE